MATALLWSVAILTSPRPELFWAVSWLAIVVSGSAVVLSPSPFAKFIVVYLGALFPGCQLAGALALARGRAPGWIAPAVLAVSTVRVAAYAEPWVAPIVGVVLEPATTLAAAWIIFRATRKPGRGRSLELAVPLLCAAALVDGLSAWLGGDRDSIPAPLLVAWLAILVTAIPAQLLGATRYWLRDEAKLRARAEQELEKTRERFRALSESAFDLIAEIDSNECFTYVNPRYEEVLGYRRDDFIMQPVSRFVHPDDLPAVSRFAAEAATLGRASDLVLRARHRDGSYRWFESVANSFEIPSSERRWVMNSRDITDRKQYEEDLERAHELLEDAMDRQTLALGESEARFRALADHAPELISEFDGWGRYTFANAAFRDLLGRDPEALLGTSPEALIHPDDLPESATSMERAVRERGASRATHRLRHVDGSWRWFDNTGRVYRTPAGKHRFVSIGRDVTEVRRAEAERRRLRDHVHDVQRLESLRVLAGGIAHDFNNLLAVILGYASLLEVDAEPGSETLESLRHIAAAARHAEALTDQMLVYAGKSASELVALDLSTLVRDTEQLLRASVPRECRLELDLADELPAVSADATQLRQVLLNLVSNAVNAIGEGGGCVRVKTQSSTMDAAYLADAHGAIERPEGEWVVLEVADDGPGLEDALRHRVFEPFYTTRQSGRGLGLAAALGIARTHHGLIKLETRVGEGASFRLLLRPSGEVVRETPGTEVGSSHEAVSGAVLLVDDDEAVRRVAQAILERGGIEVVPASSGREALEVLEGDRNVAAVLLDLAMPEMSGAEVLRVLRRDRPDLPVVIASGYKRELAADRFDPADAFAFVQKPFDRRHLLETLREALRAAHVRST